MKQHTLSLFLCVLALIFWGPQEAFAQKYVNIKYSQSVKAEAERGDAEAQFVLGAALCDGEGIEKDEKTGVKWLQKSAAQKCPMAVYRLGLCYEYGECGLPKDSIKAQQLYKEALPNMQKLASKGNALAEHYLGVMYHEGQGVKQDYKKAFVWIEKAADQGNVYAQHNLGIMYDNGKGVKQDYKKAALWYEKAAVQGNVYAQNNLGNRYYNGQGVKQDYKKAVAWYEKAAKQGLARENARRLFCISGNETVY